MPPEIEIAPDRSALSPALAPVLGARKDGTAGASSSRDLLMTVLGELVLPNGGAAWTRTLVTTLELLGVRDKAARQALARLEERGWLRRERHGRQTRWLLTDRAAELLGAGAERIYGFGQRPRDWDGRWVLLLTSIPESDRRVRYRMSQGLGWAGFGSIGPGTWISPWADREAHAVDLLADLEVDATSFIAEIGTLGSGPALAATAWDLPALRVEYEQFLAETDRVDAATLDPAHAASELTALVHRWRRFPFIDPDVPAELLDSDWPGGTAATRFTELRAALRPAATRWWLELER